MYGPAVFMLSSVLFVTSCKLKEEQKELSYPNIIYILADDMGYGDVSCYNENSKIITPNIDKLAKEGIIFTDAHTSSAVCTPTRYGILTGRYNWRSKLKSGVLSGYSEPLISQNRMTVGELLQKHDYQTGFVGKWHLGWDWQFNDSGKIKEELLNNLDYNPAVDFSKPVKNGPAEHGFDYSYGIAGSLDMPPYVYIENGLSTTIPQDTTVCFDTKGFWRKGPTGKDFRHADVLPHLTEKSVQYINSCSKTDQPFFLYFALPAPHTPILPASEFLGKSNTNFYGDFVLQVDDVVGQIIRALEENDMRNQTILIFTCDNGCSPRADFDELKKAGHSPGYIFRGHKADIYEGGHRVPFILSWPEKVKFGLKSDEIICTTDLMATVADILDYSLPDDSAEDSYSFLPVLTGEDYNKPLREAIVHHSIQGRFAIRQAQWKLILWPGSGGWSSPTTEAELKGLPKFQLYDLSEDPSETNNLINKYPDRVNVMKKLLIKYIEQGRSTPGRPQENEGMDDWDEIDFIGY